MRSDRLYFVAIVPPEPILSEVRELKEIARDKFNSSRALRSPAHITLVPPFKLADDRLEEMSASLSDAVKEINSFEIDLNGFDAFAPRVVFVKPELSDTLRSLHKGVAHAMRAYASPDTRRFHAHMTIAFKDLRKSMFPGAYEYFKAIEYRRTFAVKDVALLMHVGSEWQVLRRYELDEN